MGKLTDKQIKASKPGMHADGDGLYLQVRGESESSIRSRSWIYRFQLAGRRREMGLGSLSDIPAPKARKLAHEARGLLLDGIDPLEHRRRQEAAAAAPVVRPKTFKDVAVEYIKQRRVEWRNEKHGAQWSATLETYVYPTFGETPVADVDDAMVLEALKPIWLTKTETATRVRSRIENILDAARAAKLRSGDNPARWKGHLEHLLPSPQKIAPVVHHPALAYAQAPAFMARLMRHTGVSGLCLQWVILTACRSGEGLGARWDEIDTENAIWVVPAARTKTAREHRVPVSAAALAVLEKAKALRQSEFVFPGVRLGKPMSDMALTMLLRGMQTGLTVHGFRSCFRDWCAEKTRHANEVCEMALGHAVGDKVEAAYRRGDLFERRRALMDDWAEYLVVD